MKIKGKNMRKLHPLDKASFKAARAINLFESVKQELDMANSILDSHADSAKQTIALLQAEVERAESDRARNAKIAAKVADFLA